MRLRDLITLGISGGIVPCPAGFTIIIIAMHLQALWAGLIVLTVFSLGLSSLLIAIGVLLVLGKQGFLDRIGDRGRFLIRWLPVVSPLLVTAIGITFVTHTVSTGHGELGEMLKAFKDWMRT